MKYLKLYEKTTFQEFLNEGAYRQNYYHYTSFSNIISILEDDQLSEGNIAGISLTRSKLLHKSTDYLSTHIRLELDGDLLTNDYKIKPHFDNNLLDKEGNYLNRTWKGNPNIDSYFLEFEERVSSKIIKPLSKYLVGISVDSNFLDKLNNNNIFTNYIKQNSIKQDILK